MTFQPSGARTEVDEGATLREAAAAAGVAVAVPCGGLGTCGRCAVRVSGRLSAPSEDEVTLLRPERIAGGERLACRARVEGDVTVLVEVAGAADRIRVVECTGEAVGVIEPPGERGIDGPAPLLGAAIDLGTTTLVVRLVDLESGRTIGTASALNPQSIHGHDVMSRISAAAVSGIEALRDPLIVAIDELVMRLLAADGQGAGSLREIAVCGNATMVHLLLGADPASLGAAPYDLRIAGDVELAASEAGLPQFPQARVYVLPAISAFVGADIVAGLLATGIDESQRTSLLLDLGTNGELVLRTPEGLLSTSTAAGPALEGATISAGMFATDGAIERVKLARSELAIEVIGSGPARGLCGSGLLDLVAALLDAGVLDATGRLRPDAAHSLASRVYDVGGVLAFDVVDGVALTQLDVRQMQLAVAAVAAGIRSLLEAADIDADDVAEVVIAGGFGLHASARALARMGVIPLAWVERVRFAGNSALAGTVRALLDGSSRRRALALSRHVTTVDLALSPGFQSRFIGAMTFPEA